MKLQVFTVRDSKANTFLPPFTANNDAIAMRFIRARMEQDPNGDWARYPKDFILYRKGTFDTDTSEIEAGDALNLVTTLDTIKEF